MPFHDVCETKYIERQTKNTEREREKERERERETSTVRAFTEKKRKGDK